MKDINIHRIQRRRLGFSDWPASAKAGLVGPLGKCQCQGQGQMAIGVGRSVEQSFGALVLVDLPCVCTTLCAFTQLGEFDNGKKKRRVISFPLAHSHLINGDKKSS
jgi:hypothetical protein